MIFVDNITDATGNIIGIHAVIIFVKINEEH